VKGTAAIQRAATVIASPNFVATLADNFAFDVNIGVSPVMSEHVAHRTREPLSWIFIHRSHEYVLNSDHALSGISNYRIQSSWMKAP
jgi:hypothetical protein